MTTTPLPPPTYPEHAKHGVSKGGEISKIVIRPALYTAEQMREYRADLEAEVQRLREALQLAITQNEHDMLMTGEELRQARAALEKQP